MVEGMEKGMGVGREMIEQIWHKIQPDELPKLRNAPKERILVVKGSYDSMEDILKNAKIPFTLINNFPQKGELSQGGKYNLSSVMFVNCDNCYHEGIANKGLDSSNKREIINFVNSGGRIITTDWAQSVVRYLFGKISAVEDALEEETIKVEFPNQMARDLAGVRYGNVTPRWWIETSSDKIQYRKDSGVIELIVSEELRKKYNSKNIAIAFNQGEGEIFHFVSHLKAQKIGQYSQADRECLQSFIDQSGVLRKSNKNLGLGQIATSYTLMNTVLELCRDNKILRGVK